MDSINYRIISVSNSTGEDFEVSIPWEIQDEQDLIVFSASEDDAFIKEHSRWSVIAWNFDDKRIKIENTEAFKSWSAYIMRNEVAQMLLTKTSSREIRITDIIEQMDKDVRILQQIQESLKTTLRSPDHIDTLLPNATKRAGKMLTFDVEGNPEALYETAQITESQKYFDTKQNEIEEFISDSKEDIKNTADNAQASAQSASEYAISASESAEQAKTSSDKAKADVEEAIAEAQTIANNAVEQAQESAQRASQSESNAEFWAKQAQEISDPENRIGALQESTQALQLFKSNSGVLHFNKGTLTCKNNKWSTDSAFSYAFTFAMSQDDWTNMIGMYYGHWVNTANYGGGGNECGVWFGDVGDRLAVRFAYKKSDGTFGSKDISVANSTQWIPYLDNKSHIICASFSNELFKLRIDGKEIGSVSVTDFTPSENSQYFTVRSYGKVSDVAVFNFDITAEDAPYSINDYQNGKPISPYLLGGTFIQSSDGNTTVSAFNSNAFTASVVDGKVRVTKLNNNTANWNILSFTPTRSIKAGDVLTFTFSPVVLVAGDTGEEYYISPTSTAEYKLRKNLSDTNVPIGITFVNGGTNTIVVPKDYSTIGITLPSYANSFQNAPYPENSDSGIIREGDYITFSFSMKVNGAELALENYTFNGEVLDYSGNGRHGTITGNVAGDNDRKVETLFEKFSARIANQTNG